MPPGYLAVTGQTIEASQHNPPLEDIALALTNRLPRSGAAPMLGPLNMAGNRIINLPAPTGAADAGTKAYIDAAIATVTALIVTIPPGTFAMYAGSTVPTGWLECNGLAISRTTYAALFAAIGTRYGVGDGSTTFNVPEMRGEFPRVWDNGRGIDAGRVLGSAQAFLIQSHDHGVNDPGHAHAYNAGIAKENFGGGPDTVSGPPSLTTTGSAITGITINAAGGAETRPRNVALVGIIKT